MINARLTGNAAKELTGKLLNMVTRKRGEIVFLDEIIDTHSQQF